MFFPATHRKWCLPVHPLPCPSMYVSLTGWRRRFGQVCFSTWRCCCTIILLSYRIMPFPSSRLGMARAPLCVCPLQKVRLRCCPFSNGWRPLRCLCRYILGIPSFCPTYAQIHWNRPQLVWTGGGGNWQVYDEAFRSLRQQRGWAWDSAWVGMGLSVGGHGTQRGWAWDSVNWELPNHLLVEFSRRGVRPFQARVRPERVQPVRVSSTTGGGFL